MKNKIEFNAGIYPKVMSLTLGKPIKPNHDNIANNMEPELTIDLPRGVYYATHRQRMENLPSQTFAWR